ncbi:hypothetical protein ACFPYJ_29385 [Paenibacillus solisilvae]|uniref:Uncharacterized protein n=1 Tax=Paenibacillus solisilvae TaxID=2486751 RepID=A0ABW0W645_9BACL
MIFRTKMVVAAAIGYLIAVITSPVVPELVSLVMPVVGAAIGSFIPSKKKSQLDQPAAAAASNSANAPQAAPAAKAQQLADVQTSASSAPFQTDKPGAENGGSSGKPTSSRQSEIHPEFAPVVEYLNVLEDMMISEGQQNSLDNEIVEKSLALFARLHRVIPPLQELNNADVNHTVRRLILKDLNGFINPFLRLSGEAKTKNRRTLLNGLRDVDAKISDIVSTIEHKDLLELQMKAELIHQRYSSSEY